MYASICLYIIFVFNASLGHNLLHHEKEIIIRREKVEALLPNIKLRFCEKNNKNHFERERERKKQTENNILMIWTKYITDSSQINNYSFFIFPIFQLGIIRLWNQLIEIWWISHKHRVLSNSLEKPQYFFFFQMHNDQLKFSLLLSYKQIIV